MDAINTSENPEFKLHFLDYWRIIRLRKSLIITVFMLCMITCTGLTLLLPKQYASTVRIKVEKDAPEAPITENRVSLQNWDPYYLATQFKIIQSYSVLKEVITQLELDKVLAKQMGEDRLSVDDTFELLSKKINVDQTRGTSLIEITVKNNDKVLAAKIANTIVDVYKKNRLDQWKVQRSGGIDALKEDLDKKNQDVKTAEAELDDLRTKLQVPDVGENNSLNTQIIDSDTIRDLEHFRIEALTDYAQYSQTLSNVLKLDTNQLAAALPTAYTRQIDPDLTMLTERQALAYEKWTDATNHFGLKSTEYQTAQQQLEKANRDLADKITGIIAGLRSHVDGDKAYLDEIQAEQDHAEQRNNEKIAKFRPYFSKKRAVEDLRKDAEDIQHRLNAEIAEANQPLDSTVMVTDPGRVDRRPVSPKAIIYIPLGVIVGLVVGLGLAFFIEYLDTSVKTIDDVERSLQAPVLGVIPQHVRNILEDGPESPHAEAYRVLRTNILFSRKEEGWKTLSVLSGGAGEGKSTTLFNLAAVFAQNGQHVLVVDSDLRRPSIHKMLHVANTAGLTDYLLKQKTLEEVIQKTKMPTMDFLASGKLPSSSMSILSSARMRETIQELKRRYEFIFFDSPPLLGVSDASILASEMDMVLQVVQHRRYPQPMTLRAKQMIGKVGGNLLGIVLNNINMSQDENYYYYTGYYEHSQQKGSTVVQLSDAAAKIEVKQKY